MRSYILLIFLFFFTSINLIAQAFITTWKTDNPGTSINSSITIPTIGGVYNYDVDWDNNGTFDELGITGNITHDFGTPGTYTIRIQGDFPRIFFNDEFDKEKILSVDQWGSLEWTSMASAFFGCNNLAGQANDVPDLSIVEDMTNMFSYATNFNQDISNWNTQNITSMRSLFTHAKNFNQDISNWNVSNVTNMSKLFSGATNFNQPIGNWITNSLTEMNSMFSDATEFNQNLSNWNTENVTSMVQVFYKASSFNGNISTWNIQNTTNLLRMFFGATSFNQDLNTWNTQNVTNMRGLFFEATSFSGDISSWNTENVTTMLRMFEKATSFNGDISAWNTEKVTIMQDMFSNASSFNQNINTWKIQNVTNMVRMFSNALSFNQNLGAWNISSLTDAISMFDNVTLSKDNYDALLIGWEAQPHNNNVSFSGGNSKYCAGEAAHIALSDVTDDRWTIIDGGIDCSVSLNLDDFVTTWKTDNSGTSNNSSITIPTIGVGYNYDVDWDNDGTFDEFGITSNITHDFGTPGTYTIRIQGDFPRIFFNDDFDKEKILSVDQWGSQQWTSMNFAFEGCSNLNGVMSDTPDLSMVTDMSAMFQNATIFNQPIGNWDTSNVENMESLFIATDFNQPIGNWDTSSVTDMSGMFSAAADFNQPIGNWDTSNVIDMASMFSTAVTFNQPIGNWDTSNVTDMFNMFVSAKKFNQPIGNWNTSSVKTMTQMFSQASDFNQPLENWNTSSVTVMRSMFSGTISFNQPIGNWDTHNVINISFMFFNVPLFNQNIGSWDTSSVENMEGMFFNTTSFDQNLGTWNIGSLINATDMFKNVTLSKENYDALLIGWEAQPHNNNVSFSGGNSKYCAGEAAHIALMDTTDDHWIITDGGLDCALTVSNCPIITSPVNDDIDISINPTIKWNAAVDATKYRIVIVSVSDNTEILNEQLTNVLNYTVITSLEESTEYSITVYASNDTGESSSCSSVNFTTEIITIAPDCPIITSPINGDTDISINPTIEWNAEDDATKYRIVIVSVSDNTEILNEQLTNVLTYTVITSLEENTEYRITVYASNDTGESISCSSISFTSTSTLAIEIPKFFSPNNDGVNDYWQVLDNSNTISHIYIFDRYGKVLKKLLPSQSWNGNYIGKPMDEVDYWYLIQLNSGKQLTGHFSLLRK